MIIDPKPRTLKHRPFIGSCKMPRVSEVDWMGQILGLWHALLDS